MDGQISRVTVNRAEQGARHNLIDMMTIDRCLGKGILTPLPQVNDPSNYAYLKEGSILGVKIANLTGVNNKKVNCCTVV